MTQEVRITVDANLYYRNKERMDPAGVSYEWGHALTKLIKDFATADHKFVDVKVDIVPHDNDRDYTEEDARRHCGRTYLDAVREAFPGADVDELERSVCPGMLFPDHPSHNCGSLCPRADSKSCYECWRDTMPDGEEAQNHDD